MEGIVITVYRTVLGFAFLLFLMRLLGKKQLGELTFFNYATGIAMGNIIGDMVVHKEITVMESLASLTAWAAAVFLVELVNKKSMFSKFLTKSEPTILIKKGQIEQKHMKKMQMTMDDLLMLLRNASVFDIQEVEYAVMEPNGQLSVLKKPLKDSVTKEDLNLQPESGMYLPTALVSEGKLLKNSLKEYALTEDWLNSRLKEADVSSMKDVYFAQLTEDGELFVVKKEASQ
ncbi:YetF domain-containing protein [Fictibacillus iocasae]|uniref:YetF domain-containing protein n=1 Tax=Fictibacillus iocasae TaxID=2715437 RepID=A0ABW2NKN2_9BACL